MDEKKAVIKFWKAANEDNEQAARNALKHISWETINAQDDDGYTMLITAILEELRSIRLIRHPLKAKIITEIVGRQVDVFKEFRLPIPKERRNEFANTLGQMP